MTICYFGNYNKNYSRNYVLIKGLRENGINVLECQTRQTGFKKFISLWRQHQKIKNKYDIMAVGFAGHSVVWFAKLLSRKPIVFDIFVSLYLTNVEDRKNCPPKSFKAKYYGFLDKISCELANKVLLDTKAQIKYFVEKYKLPANKFHRIFIGCDDKIFYPQNLQSKMTAHKFIVHWHGYMVPFYGFETIIQCAKILENENIEFRIVSRFDGKSEKYRLEAKKLKNIRFEDELKSQELAQRINQADCCLGIFGNNLKAELVIPNKIIESAACGKPIITANHKVIGELFTDNKNILLVKPQDPKDLADKILGLKNNPDMANQISDNAYKLYLENLTPKILGNQLKNIL
ncbi:MAG: glycosyltransferase [Candidatus Kuenenbacteria bacterium]